MAEGTERTHQRAVFDRCLEEIQGSIRALAALDLSQNACDLERHRLDAHSRKGVALLDH